MNQNRALKLFWLIFQFLISPAMNFPAQNLVTTLHTSLLEGLEAIARRPWFPLTPPQVVQKDIDTICIQFYSEKTGDYTLVGDALAYITFNKVNEPLWLQYWAREISSNIPVRDIYSKMDLKLMRIMLWDTVKSMPMTKWEKCFSKPFDYIKPSFAVVALGEFDAFAYVSPGSVVTITDWVEDPGSVANENRYYGMHHIILSYLEQEKAIRLKIYGVLHRDVINNMKSNPSIYHYGFTIDIDTFQTEEAPTSDERYMFVVFPSWLKKYGYREWERFEDGKIIKSNDRDLLHVLYQKNYTEVVLSKKLFRDSQFNIYSITLYPGVIVDTLSDKMEVLSNAIGEHMFRRIFLRFADEVHCCTIPKELLKGK